MSYEITGIDQDSGDFVKIVIEATNEAEARERARRIGIIPEVVRAFSTTELADLGGHAPTKVEDPPVHQGHSRGKLWMAVIVVVLLSVGFGGGVWALRGKISGYYGQRSQIAEPITPPEASPINTESQANKTVIDLPPIKENETPVRSASYEKMTADQLFDKWDPNPAAAFETYRSNGVELKGQLIRISSIRHNVIIYVCGKSHYKYNDYNFPREIEVRIASPETNTDLLKYTIGDTFIIRARAWEGSPDPVFNADKIMPTGDGQATKRYWQEVWRIRRNTAINAKLSFGDVASELSALPDDAVDDQLVSVVRSLRRVLADDNHSFYKASHDWPWSETHTISALGLSLSKRYGLNFIEY